MTLLRSLLLMLVSAVPIAPVYADQVNLTLAVHPFKPPTELIDAFTPLANYLAQRTNRSVTISISKSYQDHVDNIGKDLADIAYMGPAPYVKLHDTYGAKRLLARQVIKGSPTFHGKIIVRNDSTIHSLQDLTGKRVAFGDANSTMSFLVPYYMLLQAGVPRDKLAFAGTISSHVNIVMAVLTGDYDAGAVKEDVFFEYEKKGLRAIATTPAIADHVLVASNKLDDNTVALLHNALLDLAQQAGGERILNSVTPGITAFVAANDADYSNLREILHVLRQQGIKP